MRSNYLNCCEAKGGGRGGGGQAQYGRVVPECMLTFQQASRLPTPTQAGMHSHVMTSGSGVGSCDGACNLSQGLPQEPAGRWCPARAGCRPHTPATPSHLFLPTPACDENLLLSTAGCILHSDYVARIANRFSQGLPVDMACCNNRQPRHQDVSKYASSSQYSPCLALRHDKSTIYVRTGSAVAILLLAAVVCDCCNLFQATWNGLRTTCRHR